MGTKVRYTGPHDEVEVPEAGIIAQRMEVYELDGDVAKRLLEQDTWERGPAGSKPRANPTELAPELSDTEEG